MSEIGLLFFVKSRTDLSTFTTDSVSFTIRVLDPLSFIKSSNRFGGYLSGDDVSFRRRFSSYASALSRLVPIS